MLESFVIHQFKTFPELEFPNLGEVNLLVGKNNVGKSAVLEALRLYFTEGSLTTIRELLIERDEMVSDHSGDRDDGEARLRYESLFHGWRPSYTPQSAIRLGPASSPQAALMLRLAPMTRRVSASLGEPPVTRFELADVEALEDPQAIPGLVVSFGGTQRFLPLDTLARDRRAYRAFAGTSQFQPAYVPARGLSHGETARAWDAVSLRDAERRVVESLRLIAPVERISFVEITSRPGLRVPWVRMSGMESPVPLRSLGDGIARVFQFALSMEMAALSGNSASSSLQMEIPGLSGVSPKPHLALLIDEVENGIHYSALPAVWDFIFRTAKLHGVQVFATSHSWDCLTAFQSVASASASVGRLYRLERDSQQAVSIVDFDESELEIAAAQRIEIR